MSTSSVWRVVFTSSVCVSPRADGLADGLGVLICQQLSWPDAERLSLAIPPSARKDCVQPLRLSSACPNPDRKSTRLNSSHVRISYAVFCLKKKKQTQHERSLSHVPPRHNHFDHRPLEGAYSLLFANAP